MIAKYNVKDTVYYVNDFRIVKSIVKEVIVKTDKNGTNILYNIKAVLDGKERMSVEAQLVESLAIAKQSATVNWATITRNVAEQIDNMTEKSFEPMAKINDK